MMKITCLILYLVGSLTKIAAFTDAEKEAFRSTLVECFTEHGLNEEDIAAAKRNKNVDNINPCFIGCGLKKINMIDNNGKFTPDKGLATLKDFFKSDEDSAKFAKASKECLKVNDQVVSDGNAGCERGKLVIICAYEHNLDIPI